MGDSARNEVFASFVKRNWPKVERVLVVADGRGELARKLANKGFRVRIIEAQPRFVGRLHTRIEYEKGWFTRDTPVPEELIVGMHPDDATGEIVLAARNNGLPWAVVPCCIRGPEANGVDGYTAWLKKLMALDRTEGEEPLQTQLPMTGKSIVLWRKRPRRQPV